MPREDVQAYLLPEGQKYGASSDHVPVKVAVYHKEIYSLSNKVPSGDILFPHENQVSATLSSIYCRIVVVVALMRHENPPPKSAAAGMPASPSATTLPPSLEGDHRSRASSTGSATGSADVEQLLEYLQQRRTVLPSLCPCALTLTLRNVGGW